MKYKKIEEKGKRAKYIIYLPNDDVRILYIDRNRTTIQEVLERLYPKQKEG